MELFEALLLAAGPEDLALSIQLQEGCHTYMRFVQQHPPCIAPNYPRPWLVKRALGSIMHFQDPHALALALAAGAAGSGAVGGGAGGVVAGALSAAALEGAGAGAGAGGGGVAVVTTWWDIAAAGLREWYRCAKVTLSTASPTAGFLQR
jgi:hypothetical protein